MTFEPTAAARQIRVFISSTFRDMHGERDRLVKFVFPRLRRLCEQRGVTWGEVDLRWGVTDEAAAEGKVLPICLEEIGRCRPYFIGLLGERYGWVPDTIPEELLEREDWLREQFQEGKSVTELEILHGVLRDPAVAGHAYFYLRDPEYVDRIPEGDRQDFVCASPVERAKLEDLKRRIRESGLPVRENYRDPEALGDLVLADLTAVIDARWPEGSEPDPLTREELDHAAYARSRERAYIGRPEYLARLDAHAADRDLQSLVVLGEPGSGKSALLANWAARYRQAHPSAFVLEHFIGATPQSSDWAAMLRRILGEFAKRLGIVREIPEDTDALRSAFPNWLHMAASRGPVILVLDALNQLKDKDGAPDLVWLPAVMPENVRLIVSTLPGRPLDEISKRGWPVFRVEPLTVSERQELIREFLSDYGRALSPARVERIASAPQSANPLYLRVLLDELRLFGEHERLEERIEHYLRAASPYELYGTVIGRWDEDYGAGTGLVADTLSLLWAARRGLTESELLEALGQDGEPMPRATWSPLFLAMGDALVSRSGLLTFAHDFLRTAARDSFLATDSQRRQVHLRLGDFFDRRPHGSRRTEELPWQLAEARAWKRLSDLLVKPDFFKELWNQDPFDVKTCWAQIEAGSELRLVEAYRDQIDDAEGRGDFEFLWCLAVMLGATGHSPEALRLHSLLVEISRKTGEEHLLQASLGNQANVMEKRGDLDGAMALYREQEQICRRLGDLDGLQRSLGNQALILRTRGDLDGAMALLEEQEQVCRELGLDDGLQRSLLNQAVILDESGDPDGAMARYEEQERICRQMGNLDDLQASLGNQSLILFARGETEASMTLAREQERISRQLGNLDGLQASLGNQAMIFEALGDPSRATELAEEQERICRRLGDPDRLHHMLLNQASMFEARGDLGAAMKLYGEAGEICRQVGNLAGLARVLNQQVLILTAREEIGRAMMLAKEQEEICRQTDNLDGLQASLGNQANIMDTLGDFDGAMALYEEQARICRQMGEVKGVATSLANQAVALVNRGRAREALPLAEEAHELAYGHGLAAEASQISHLLDYIRQAAGQR